MKSWKKHDSHVIILKKIINEIISLSLPLDVYKIMNKWTNAYPPSVLGNTFSNKYQNLFLKH